MALLQLASRRPTGLPNEDLGYIIAKNPASGMRAKTLRSGVLFGWFSPDASTYNVLFRDAENEVSFKPYQDDTFEYLNTTRYNSPLFVTNAFSDFFQTTLKVTHEKDLPGVATHTLKINLLRIMSEKYITIFNQYFDDYQIEATLVAPRNYQITITSQRTIRELLNYTSLFVAFNTFKDKSVLYEVSDPVIHKYLESLDLLDPPYFVRYVFKVNLIRSRKLMETFGKKLQTSNREKIELAFGSTSVNRMIFVESHLQGDRPIVDVGCGDNFVFGLRRWLKDRVYYGIDVDHEVLAQLAVKVERKEMAEQVNLFPSWQEFVDAPNSPDEKFDALLVEVLEHMELDAAKGLLLEVLSHPNLERLLLTTPCQDFNQFYLFDDEEMRHDDHKWEMTKVAFEAWVTENTPQGFKVSFHSIGDVVNDIPTTLGAKFVREEVVNV